MRVLLLSVLAITPDLRIFIPEWNNLAQRISGDELVFKFVNLQGAHPQDEWTNKKVEHLVLQHHTNITERIRLAEKLFHDLC